MKGVGRWDPPLSPASYSLTRAAKEHILWTTGAAVGESHNRVAGAGLFRSERYRHRATRSAGNMRSAVVAVGEIFAVLAAGKNVDEVQHCAAVFVT